MEERPRKRYSMQDHIASNSASTSTAPIAPKRCKISKPLFELSQVPTDLLVHIMNKLPAKEFLRLRRTTRGMNTFCENYSKSLGVCYPGVLTIHQLHSEVVSTGGHSATFKTYRDPPVKILVDGQKGFSLNEAMESLSCISFRYVEWLDYDKHSEFKDSLPKIMDILSDRKWRATGLTVCNTPQEVVQLLKPKEICVAVHAHHSDSHSFARQHFSEYPLTKSLGIHGINQMRSANFLEEQIKSWKSGEISEPLVICVSLPPVFYYNGESSRQHSFVGSYLKCIYNWSFPESKNAIMEIRTEGELVKGRRRFKLTREDKKEAWLVAYAKTHAGCEVIDVHLHFYCDMPLPDEVFPPVFLPLPPHDGTPSL